MRRWELRTPPEIIAVPISEEEYQFRLKQVGKLLYRAFRDLDRMKSQEALSKFENEKRLAAGVPDRQRSFD